MSRCCSIFFCHRLHWLLKSQCAHYFSLWLHQISHFHCNMWNVFQSPQCKCTTLFHSHAVARRYAAQRRASMLKPLSIFIFKCWHLCYYFSSAYINFQGHTGCKNRWIGSNLSKITRPVAAIKSLRFALFYSSCYYHHQIGSIHLSHCYHIFPWLCVWDVCYITSCYLLHILSGKTGNLFSLLLCSLWWVQIIGYVLCWRSYSFVCTLHHVIIIIINL